MKFHRGWPTPWSGRRRRKKPHPGTGAHCNACDLGEASCRCATHPEWVGHPTILRIAALLVFALIVATRIVHAAEPESKPLFTILYTAESHAALLPCDCPLQPLGGVARRTTLIKRFRERGPVLLLDGGGWAAGGIYDEDSDGEPERDKLRTQLMSDAMRLMKYDAGVLAPNDIAAIKVPSNAPVPAPQNILHATRANGTMHADTLKIAGFEIDIFGWTENGTLPGPWHLPGNGPKYLNIHLARYGEEASESLVKNNGADVVLVAGRKTSQRTDWRSGKALFVNFDYQSRHLVVIEVHEVKDKIGGVEVSRLEYRPRLEPLGKDIPDDPEITKLLAPHLDALKKKGKKRIEIEYWMMPDCPGCKLARPELQAIAKELAGRVSIVPHWVVEKRGDELSSLHGDEELNEARVQVLIAKYYPERIWEWLEWRAEHRDAWSVGAEKLGLLRARIEQALNAKEADALLFADVELSERRRVHATPSLVIANRLYEGEIDRAHLLGALCGSLEAPKPDCCKDAPACFFDAQCRTRGFVAKCIDAGTPKARCDASKPAVKIPATILVDTDALSSNQEKILEALIGDLPGLDYALVDIGSPEGKRLAERAKVTRLPAYLLDPIATTEDAYKVSVGRVAREISFRNERDAETKMLLLREDQYGVGANRILARPRIKGRADLFVSRFGKNGQEALETALECAASREAAGLTLVLHDALYFKPAEDDAKPQLAAKNGIAEVEEAARAMAVRLTAPEKLNAYLLERGKKRGGSYWDAPLKAVGVDAEKIRALAEEPSAAVLQKLEEEAALLKSLDAGGEIVLLAENCELISVVSRRDLRQILERIASRKP